MSTLQHFHRFRDLPRELQLLIWEFYERAQPHHRHYFRNMSTWPGRLYAAADQYTHMRVSTVANAGDPNQTEVPDPAVAPNIKIELPGSGNLDQNWVSQDQVISATSFVTIQVPDAMASPAYVWVNFKNDSFCFADNSLRPSHHSFRYLQGVIGVFPLNSASQSPVMPHWFHQIQNLVLIKSADGQTLGPFDRQVLRAHRSLRTLTILARLNACSCRVPRYCNPAIRPERVSLTTFRELSQASSRTCTCGNLRDRLDELEELKTDLVELFRTRTDSAPPVVVDVEIEVHPRTRGLTSGC